MRFAASVRAQVGAEVAPPLQMAARVAVWDYRVAGETGIETASRRRAKADLLPAIQGAPNWAARPVLTGAVVQMFL